jgi:hypothetical protein
MHSVVPLYKIPEWSSPLYICTRNKFIEERISSSSISTLGCGIRLVTIGSRRRRAKCTEYFGVISVFIHVRFVFWRGERVRLQNVTKYSSKCYRTLHESTMPICSGFFKKALHKNEKYFLLITNEMVFNNITKRCWMVICKLYLGWQAASLPSCF